ncbi:MAG: diacylglycerol kinase family lipid kinase [Deltaproteobacteria bacterium]|nr:diacylglycerol kinase family lipid kinase [Deltaproteobacteria bacterium]
MKFFFIVNPNSKNGHTRRIWPKIEKQLNNKAINFEYRLTKAPLDAIEIAKEATNKKFDVIVSVGGDGTNNEVLNGIMLAEVPIDKRPSLGFIPQGTGGDFRRSIHVTPNIERAIEILINSNRLRIDIGEVRFLDHSKTHVKRYFLNICSFGISGLVDYYVNHTTKLLGGKISFMIGTLRGIFNYKNTPANIIVDGRDLGRMNITLVAVANGKYFGGSMMVAPDAELNDGVFDIVIMKDITKFRFILDGRKIYKGKHIKPPNVFSLKGKSLQVNTGGLYIDLDGEDVGTTPAEFIIIPKAINIIIP